VTQVRAKRPLAASVWFTLAMLALPEAAAAGPELELESPDGAATGAAAAEREDEDHWTIGAGVAAVPRFQGSDEYVPQPLPLIDVQYGRFFAKVGEGIGVNLIDTSVVTAGASVNWMQGYDGDDVADGIDTVDSALGARFFVSGRYEGVVATLSAIQAVTDTDRGLLVNASLAYPIRATERFTIVPSLGASWANGTYMDGYFGVDASEAAASGLGRYEPSSGLKDVSFRVRASYRITDSISAVGAVGVTHLLDEAGESPIVEQRTQPTALLGLTYTF
jgi:outer membrane protein